MSRSGEQGKVTGPLRRRSWKERELLRHQPSRAVDLAAVGLLILLIGAIVLLLYQVRTGAAPAGGYIAVVLVWSVILCVLVVGYLVGRILAATRQRSKTDR